MSVHHHRAVRHANGSTPAARWHRRVGLALVALVLVVCATGFLLNHAEGLGLRDVPLRAAWLYRWYGMQAKSEPIAYPWAAGRHAVWLEGTLYLDAKPVARTGELRGTAVMKDAWVAATPREITLLTPNGELIERLDAAALPPDPVARAGVSTDGEPRLVVGTESGRDYLFDESLLGFQELPAVLAARVAWSEPVPLPPVLREEVLAGYRGEGLTLHRIVLDLHSGRFFGAAGVYVVDAVALGLLFLAATGVYSALTGRRR